MVKGIVYPVLFALAYATVTLAAVPPVKRGSDSARTLTKRINDDYGCYKGYCWSYCSAVGGGAEWCYTTKTYSQSFSYVPCKSKWDCREDWKCAGSCSL